MNPRDPTLPPRKVLQELIRKYDAVQPFDNDDHHWMVNVLHVLNDDPDYQRHQDELDDGDKDAVASPHESINIAPKESDSETPDREPASEAEATPQPQSQPPAL